MAGASRRRVIETIVVDVTGGGSAVNFDGAVRQPFAYHAGSRRLYVGHPGMHHGEISFTKQWPDDLDFDACYQGEINHTPYGVVLHYQTPFDVRPDGELILTELQRLVPELDTSLSAVASGR